MLSLWLKIYWETFFLLLGTTAVFTLLFYLFEERPLTSSNLVEFKNNSSGKVVNSINLHRCQCKYHFLSETSPWCGYYFTVTPQRHCLHRLHRWATGILQWNKSSCDAACCQTEEPAAGNITGSVMLYCSRKVLLRTT